MVRNNTQLENAVKHIDLKIDQLLHTRKVIDGLLNDLAKLDSGEPAQPNHLIQEPAPSLLTNFPSASPFAEPLATGGTGVVPGPAISFDEFSPLQAERGRTSSPLCQFNQGDYVEEYSPQPVEVSFSQLFKEYCNFIVILYRRAFRQLRQAALFLRWLA